MLPHAYFQHIDKRPVCCVKVASMTCFSIIPSFVSVRLASIWNHSWVLYIFSAIYLLSFPAIFKDPVVVELSLAPYLPSSFLCISASKADSVCTHLRTFLPCFVIDIHGACTCAHIGHSNPQLLTEEGCSPFEAVLINSTFCDDHIFSLVQRQHAHHVSRNVMPTFRDNSTYVHASG